MADPQTPTPKTDDAAPERLGLRALATAVYAASRDIPTTWIDQSDGGLDDVERLLVQQADIEREDLAAALGLPPADGIADRDLEIANKLTQLAARPHLLAEQTAQIEKLTADAEQRYHEVVALRCLLALSTHALAQIEQMTARLDGDQSRLLTAEEVEQVYRLAGDGLLDLRETPAPTTDAQEG